MKEFIVDRIEGCVVILEDENCHMLTISVDALPPCNEGDLLIERDGVYTVDRVKTQERRQQAFLLEEKLKRKFQK